jgi:hypothetical protein
MTTITRSTWLGPAAALAVSFVTTGAEAYPVRRPGSGLTALSTTVQGVQRTPTNAGPVGTRITVGVPGTSLTPAARIPIQTPLGGTTSINGTQTLLRNTPYSGTVTGSTIYNPMPAYNGTGFSTGRFRTNTSAYRAIPGPILIVPPSSLGNPAYQNGQLPALLSAKPLEPAAGDDERHKLLKVRYNADLQSLQASFKRYQIDPTTTAANVIAAARWLLAADLALAHDAATPRERYLELMKYLEREAEVRFRARLIGRDELEAVHEARHDAELEFLKSKTGRASPAKPDLPSPPSH